MDMNRILDKVQKCFNIANCETAPQTERDRAMEQAMKFLAHYNLSMAQVHARKDEADASKPSAEPEPRKQHIHQFGGWPWARNIAWAIADMCSCYYIFSRGRTDRTCNHYFIGGEANAVTAALLSEFVVKSVIREAAKWVREHQGINNDNRAFCQQAMYAVRDRCLKLKADASRLATADEQVSTEQQNANAIVLRSFYEKEVEANRAFIAVHHPSLRSSRGMRGAHGSDAGAAGRAFGNSVSLNRQVK